MLKPCDLRTVAWSSSAEALRAWLDEHARPGDVVCDLERLIWAISSQGGAHVSIPEPSQATAIAVMMREGLIAFLEDRPLLELRVIVATSSAHTAQYLARRIGARVVCVPRDYRPAAPAIGVLAES